MQVFGVFSRVMLGLSTAVCTSLSVASPITGEAVLQPVKPWVLDYAEAQCAAGRDFGEAAKPITLTIRPLPRGDAYELQLIRQTAGPALAEEDQGSVDFGNGPVASPVLHFGSVAAKLDILQFRVASRDMEQARQATAITFRNAHGPNTSFALTSMPALLTGLSACNTDLRRYWNIDNPAAVQHAQPARGDLRRVFTSDDYPSDALNDDKEGSAQFLLLIDKSGNIAACDVLQPSGVPLLDAMGCQVLRKRAKFSPARDATGEPVRDSYITPPVSWAISSF